MSPTPEKSAYPLPVRIAGVGRYVPPHRVPSADLEREVDRPEGWCKRYQGVEERRWVENETASFMGAEAVREAVQDANLELPDVDALIHVSSYPEQMVPDGSALILRELGLGESGVAGFSMHTTCLSFLTAFDVASCLIAIGRWSRVAIVSSEISSAALDRSDPDTYTLLGDGAAAAILVRSGEGEASCVHGAVHRTYASGAEHARLYLGTRIKPLGSPRREDLVFHMEGKRILRSGEKHAPAMLEALFQQSGVRLDEIALAVTHQASKIALDFLALNVSEHRLLRIIDRYGNCASASIPMALYEGIKTQRMKRGDKVLITGPAGAGMNVGGVVITY